MMRKISSRQAKRLMNQLGMKVDELQNIDHVIIKTPKKEILIEAPNVSVTHLQGQTIYQIMGGKTRERTAKEGDVKKDLIIPEEDIHLVAQQAKVSFEDAKKALEETSGDLAQAILNISQKL